jgi:chorismate synthase
MLRFSTAGESHGESLVALVSGLPAGIPIDQAALDLELYRRQQGYGRGGRMRIEQDRAHILSGVRHGKTIGSPIAMTLANNDWKNWEDILPVGAGDADKHKAVKSPRPGHADLPGALKYNFPDARYVLERASARESAARVACGAMAKALLAQFGILVGSHTVRVGGVELTVPATWDAIARSNAKPEVLLNCVDPDTEARMKAEVDRALRTGDTVGGVFEVVVHGLPPGLGTHVNWDERLDGLLAQAVMSLQAVKAVELGRGVTAAQSMGSAVHDSIHYTADALPVAASEAHLERHNLEHEDGGPKFIAETGATVPGEQASQPGSEDSKGNAAERAGDGFTRFARQSNNAGGLEGGISNGEDLVIRGYLKPISTLRRPLASVSFETREETKAAYERSDVCVVPAAGVAAEAMVALTVARVFLEKFGGDSLVETRRNFEGYLDQIRQF